MNCPVSVCSLPDGFHDHTQVVIPVGHLKQPGWHKKVTVKVSHLRHPEVPTLESLRDGSRSKWPNAEVITATTEATK